MFWQRSIDAQAAYFHSLQKKSKVNCWVTGAHGFIGRNLSRYLAGSGCQVAGIGHGVWAPSEFAAWGLDYWLNGEVGIGNLIQMKQDCGKPDIVFHLAGGSSVGAALANPLEDFRRTVTSTSELLDWMRLNGRDVRLVAVSSAAVYGSGHDGRISEKAKMSPFSTYGSHKFLMEEVCRDYATNYSLNIVLPRLFSVYGCGLKKQLLWDLCVKMSSGKTVELGGNGEEWRDWMDVRDVVLALSQVSLIASTEAPSVNIASGQEITVREAAKMMGVIWAASGNHSPAVNFSGVSRPGDPFSLIADVSRMRALGISTKIPTSQGFAEYVSWYRDLIRVS